MIVLRRFKMASNLIELVTKKADEADKLLASLQEKVSQLKGDQTLPGDSTKGLSAEERQLEEENARLRKEVDDLVRQLKAKSSGESNHVQESEESKLGVKMQQAPAENTTKKETKEKEKKNAKQADSKAAKKKELPKADASTTNQTKAESQSDEDEIDKLDLRIGKIIDVKRHPDADALYLEQIELGEEKPRTVISGLVKFLEQSELQNRMVVVLCNLKPVKMRGILSEAMVMCASTPEKVEPLDPPTGAAPGDLVLVEGFDRKPEPVLNPKKKIFERVAPHLKTNEKAVATYKGNSWVVRGKGEVTTKSLCNVPIK